MKARSKKKRAARPARTPAPAERQRMIAEAAYLRAASRNFEGGNDLEDWLEAEREIDERLAR